MSKKPREFWILNKLHANNDGRVIGFDCNLRAQQSVEAQPKEILGTIHVIEYSSYQALERKLEIAKTALEEAERTFHYVYCVNEQTHSYFCKQTRAALKEIEG